MLVDLAADLAGNTYPGRGIILGRSTCGKYAYIVYFIMGRSVNSRNRVFVAHEDGIRTQACDSSLMKDPSLIIYSPVRVFEGKTIVTNGDQTDTIYAFLAGGKGFTDALRTRSFEPDEPNWTPRISGIVDKNGAYKLSMLKCTDGKGEAVSRCFFEYPQPVAGQGHFIHTYSHDGTPLASFEGEPKTVETKGKIADFAQLVWDNLNEENRVSLFARSIKIETGETKDVIINKYEIKK